MSVLIKGMDMPENCLVCFVPCSLLCDLDDYDRKRIRHPKCPCVEISTPHGRLIDADELEVDTEWSDYYDGYQSYSAMQIKYAPTVIDKE